MLSNVPVKDANRLRKIVSVQAYKKLSDDDKARIDFMVNKLVSHSRSNVEPGERPLNKNEALQIISAYSMFRVSNERTE